MPSPSVRGVRLAVAVLLVLAVGWLSFRAVQAFDRDRHAAEAAAVMAAPDAVVYRLSPAPVNGVPPGAGGEMAYRPEKWLTVVRLRGLEPVQGRERYLVFLRNYWGWVLAGALRPDAGGAAELRTGAEPRPPTIFEVLVTRGVDDATSVPHGQPVLHWYDGAIAPAKARPFDFTRGV